jgi:hypothetical protein
MRRDHAMECRDAVSLLELVDSLTHLLDEPGDVVAGVHVRLRELGVFPVLWVAPCGEVSRGDGIVWIGFGIPEKMTLMRTSSSLGSGIGESMMLIEASPGGPPWKIPSFMVAALICVVLCYVILVASLFSTR